MSVDRSPLLSALTDEDRRRVLQQCRRVRFGTGAYVFHAGEAGDSLHIIDHGLVAVLSGGQLGDPVMLRVLTAGDAFGEQALLSPSRVRTATIQALLATETLVLARADFDELRQAHRSVDEFLVAVLAAEVRRLSDQVVEQLEVPATVRIYRRIVSMGELFGATTAGSVIPLAQQHIASMAGVRLRLTNRVLADARQHQLLSTARGRLIVLDWAALCCRARLPRSS